MTLFIIIECKANELPQVVLSRKNAKSVRPIAEKRIISAKSLILLHLL